jgi:hypothetical protein
VNVADLPRHIQEHVKHCDDCEPELCAVGAKLLADWKTIAARIDKLPKLSDYGSKPKEVR